MKLLPFFQNSQINNIPTTSKANRRSRRYSTDARRSTANPHDLRCDGTITSGTAKVRLEVLESDATTNDFYKIDIKKLDLKGFAIQVGSFSDFQNMMSQLHALRKLHLENVYVQERMVRGKKVHRIVMGGFPTRAEAEGFLPELRKLGKKGFVFQVR